MWLLTFARLPRRGVRWLLTFARFSAQGHHVPSPSGAFLGGDSMHREGALSPWMGELAESSTHGSRWCGAVIMWMRECALHTAVADVGLLSCEWESVLYTQQPLMWGCYHVNERVSSTHGSRWCWAGIMWMRGYPLHTAAADEGLISCQWVRSKVIVLCTQQNTALRLSAPTWKGDVRSRADVLSCRFDGWEECGHLVGMSSSPESLRSTADQRADGLFLRKCVLTWTLQRDGHQACPRMSEV